MKTKILFCFDCEDFTSNASDEMLLRLANTLSQEGVRGNFMMVGLLAEKLERERRQDIISAMCRHAIGFHTYGHSLHPTVAEYTDADDYRVAKSRLEAQETEAIETVKRVFSRENLVAAVPPGNSLSYAAMYFYAEKGIPAYADSVLREGNTGEIRMAGALQIPYTTALEDILFDAAFDPVSYADSIAESGLVTLYNHPNIINHSLFWDAVNYDGENLHPFGEWEEAPHRAEEDVERFFANLASLIRVLRADARFTVTDLAAETAKLPPVREIRREEMLSAVRALAQDGIPPYSFAELVLAASAFLADDTSASYTLPLAYGFLEEPLPPSECLTLTADEIRVAAQQIQPGEFLPTSLTVGDKKISAGEFLLGAAAVLSGEEVVHIEAPPHPQLPSQFETLAKLSLAGTWLHAKTFADKNLSRRLRLQAATICRTTVVPSGN